MFSRKNRRDKNVLFVIMCVFCLAAEFLIFEYTIMIWRVQNWQNHPKNTIFAHIYTVRANGLDFSWKKLYNYLNT